jgi:peptidoglycan/xylan/chitin deacetylase (PgdA/CDA1 family)
MEKLVSEGHEIGIHGCSHDPNLAYQSFDVLCEKLSTSRALLDWILESPPGYRSPWLSRNSVMRKALKATGYLYDSSSPTADFQRRSSSSNNGCCTLFPFLCDGILEVPLTLPTDAAYYTLNKSPQEFWNYIFELIEEIKKRGGLAVISTHIQPHHSANLPMLEGYKGLLKRLSQDDEAWFALPTEIVNAAKF